MSSQATFRVHRRVNYMGITPRHFSNMNKKKHSTYLTSQPTRMLQITIREWDCGTRIDFISWQQHQKREKTRNSDPCYNNYIQQERQCTYNIKLTRVHKTTIAVEKQ